MRGDTFEANDRAIISAQIGTKDPRCPNNFAQDGIDFDILAGILG